MAPLILAALLVAGSPGQDETWRWAAEIEAAAIRCGVSGDWIARVMRAESGGRTILDGRPIRSPKGAIGLMQLMPATWAELRRDLGLGEDPDLPADNIVAGACYLRRMYDRFGYPGLFAAYNAGPARYADWLAGRAGLPAETAAYLRGLGGSSVIETPAATPAPEPLFVVRRASPEGPAAAGSPHQSTGLFVLRREDR
ncbi:lytic transglycosylase domain-containing protein [Sphingomonas sp. QA11]|uniref:lytic transglycosylase domain-containing protein n=1 Tax=Sphingomonas sp. QA11 TaxID=2950605 RepID=UPI00234B1E61|nr:lytic transglycosylase domain-containing protein [Sphingomonas sp. QA11]WCM26302.1 lytic transglycosylase domain-containing protein [Sphingomonas sp. QA11]